MRKSAQAEYPIHELLAQRWSPRAYAPDRVEPAKLRRLLEAARWSASSGNGQPWSFILATNEETEPFARMVACLKEGNVPWASKAPVLGIVVAKLIRANGSPNRHAFYDSGMAMQNLIVQATALDLFLRQMGGFDPETARRLFDIPLEYEAATMFALGYPGDPDSLTDSQREQELALRVRRPLSEFVFGDRWGAPASFIDV